MRWPKRLSMTFLLPWSSLGSARIATRSFADSCTQSPTIHPFPSFSLPGNPRPILFCLPSEPVPGISLPTLPTPPNCWIPRKWPSCRPLPIQCPILQIRRLLVSILKNLWMQLRAANQGYVKFGLPADRSSYSLIGGGAAGSSAPDRTADALITSGNVVQNGALITRKMSNDGMFAHPVSGAFPSHDPGPDRG